MENDISIFLVDWKGEVVGEILNVFERSKGKRLINQIKISQSKDGLELSKNWILEKVRLLILHLEELNSPTQKVEEINMIVEYINLSTDPQIIRGFEGRIGRIYFKELRRQSKSKEEIGTRNLRPASDSFNISLNYTYGMLYRELQNLFFTHRLEPTIGFFHTNEGNKNSLIFDFIEKYRVYFLKNIYNHFQNNRITINIFEIVEGKNLLKKDGKIFLIGEFNKIMSRQYQKNSKKTLREKIKEEIKELREFIDDFSSI